MVGGKMLIRLLRIAIVVGVMTLFLMAIGSIPPARAGAGSPSASSPNPQVYCNLYDQTLADKLHVKVAVLDAARVSALRTVIQKALSDGAITQTEEQSLMTKVNQLATNPCAAVGRIAAQHGSMQQVFAGAHQTLLTAVAGALNMPAATLESDLAAGQTVQMIAATQKVNLDQVNAAYLGAAHDMLQKAVSDGKITQDQADASYSAFQRAVANGVYPLLRAHK